MGGSQRRSADLCEDVDGTCLYRRQDVTLDVEVRR
jgi:hypothetical protein